MTIHIQESTKITAPFRYDHVGSLLRTEPLKQAREDYKAGTITYEELKNVENAEIIHLIEKQKENGLIGVTDGEFRRSWWHFDFLGGLDGVDYYEKETGLSFHKMETRKEGIRVSGQIDFSDHPFLEHFRFVQEHAGDAVVKQTIPSPNMLLYRADINDDRYQDREKLLQDTIAAYQKAIQAFYDAGCRYLQLDDVYIAGLNAPEIPFNDSGYSREELIDLALRVANGVLEDKPEDLIITTHLCRGNYRSKWAFEGSYAKIAPTLFAKEKVNGFFLEYDDDRSGDFGPLNYIPNGGPQVVLGVFTSKHGELEVKENIKARIEEATKYVPLEQLCISPQCGFASTHHGNILTEDEQWTKLKYIVDISKEIWG